MTMLTRISHEVWTGARGGESGARDFGSGRAGEVFRPLLVAGEVVQSRPRRCASTPRRLETARAVGFRPNRVFSAAECGPGRGEQVIPGVGAAVADPDAAGGDPPPGGAF